MTRDLDDMLMGANEIVKGGIGTVIGNLGKIIALIALAVACTVTFTDVSLIGVETERYATTLVVMIISSYVMYFSLFDVGEERGKECHGYISAKERFSATRVKINGDMMPELRDFCEEYSRAELEYRRRELLMSYGLSEAEAKSAERGSRAARIRRKSERMRAAPLTPRALLTAERGSRGGELENPERGKLIRSFLRLLPSTVCTCLTVSIVLSFKEGMTLEDVLNGIIKLSALPIIGIRGYLGGIDFAEKKSSAWLETKARILETFLKRGAHDKTE